MSAPVDGIPNVMEPRFFPARPLPVGLERALAAGVSHDDLAAGRFEWLQLLVHPEIWVYPGETMGETMRAFLAADHERRLELLRADRIDLE